VRSSVYSRRWELEGVLTVSLEDCDCLQVLLLEAYEQLEHDVGKEVDRALAKQAEELSRLSRRVTFLEGHLDKERAHVKVVEDRGASLEAQLEDALARNTQYESGVYGLPQVRIDL
jgi:centrosomal protein CEP290